ncbi:MAG: ATP-binding cassette domain-containing protein [Treponema sp.]|nr:ATP-binding cassette domain-containing protein [Treponema sp.]
MIEIQKVNKTFITSRGKRQILKDFSLTISDGTFLGISGESGIGKSTLISLIAGLQKPDAGSIFIDKKNICLLNDREMSAFRNKNIGYISQEESFLENLTVFENLLLPFWLKHRKEKSFMSGRNSESENKIMEKAASLLSELGISELSQMQPSLLSGGENQRLLIARALINDPKIIIADEPTSALSERQTIEIIEIFKKVSEMGKTVILVSHDKTALSLCQRIITL